MTSPSSTLRRRLVLLCCSLAFVVCAGLAYADDTPTFSDPAVTQYAKDYNDFVNQYVAFMKDYMAAMNANDAKKMEAISTKVQDFQTKGTDLQTKAAAIQGKLKPEEAQKFADYLEACAKRMTDGLK